MISAPHWAKNAIPTQRGWVNERGELLKSQKISITEINEYNSGPVQLNEAPPVSKPVEEMTVVEQQNVTPPFNLFFSPQTLSEDNSNED